MGSRAAAHGLAHGTRRVAVIDYGAGDSIMLLGVNVADARPDDVLL